MDKQCDSCGAIVNVKKHVTRCNATVAGSQYLEKCGGTLTPINKMDKRKPKRSRKKKFNNSTHPVEQHTSGH